MKEKKDNRNNLNMKSSDSVERYQKEFEGFPDDHSQDIGNTFNFDGNILYQGSPMLELNSFSMPGGFNGNIPK